MKYALESAGPNRNELEYVLDYYKDEPEKYKAALFLIENMPGHYSYLGDAIDDYYTDAIDIMRSSLSPVEQRDSLLKLSDAKYLGLDNTIIQDIKIITAEQIIHNIDRAFDEWKNRSYCEHVDFDTFCEWILPYKCVELQQIDSWRDTLSNEFSNDLKQFIFDDETKNSPFRALDLVRNEILRKVKPYGVYTRSGYPMLSASTLKNMTFGRCADYVNLGVLTYRSLGLPVVIDETPIWGRYRAGHTWYVLLGEKGEELPSEWDISSVPGTPFFQYQRIPKVYRNTYSINRERVYYSKHSKLNYPFSLFQKDVTDKYFATSEISFPIDKNKGLVEDYAYIASFCGHNEEWKIIDYGEIIKGKVTFNKMGRNVLYVVLGYDGKRLKGLTEPFVLKSNGEIEFVIPKTEKRHNIDIYRKYYTSENVINMQHRVLGGEIQASNDKTFINATTIYKITDLKYPDKIPIDSVCSYRYWRYVSPNGSYGNVAELAFFDQDSINITGTYIGDNNVYNIHDAFDGDWLTYYDSKEPDGNWIGMDFKQPTRVSYIRIVPRGDDNYIRVGDTYELKIWDGNYWLTVDKRIADDNCLHYKNMIENCLYWIDNKTRGWDERPFIVESNGEITWW